MPHYASTQIEPYEESLRGGVPPFNGGSGGSLPQIRVLPPLGKSQLASMYRLPLRLRQELPDLVLTIDTEFNPDERFCSKQLSYSHIPHPPSPISPQFTNALDRIASDRNLRIYYRVSRLSYRHTLASRHRLLS
jgi:hypothetical protein